MIGILKIVNGIIENILMKTAIVSLVIFVFVVALDVFARNVPFIPTILWGQEIAMMAFIWSVFSGGAVTYRKGEHFKIEILPQHYRNTLAIKIIILIFAIIFALILFKEGFTLALTIGLKRGSRPSGIPLIWVFISIPLAGTAMILFTIEKIAKMNIVKKAEYKK